MNVGELSDQWDAELLGTPEARRRGVRIAEDLDRAMGAGTYRHPDGPIPLRPVLLSQQCASTLASLSRRMLGLLKRTCDVRASRPSELAELLGYRRPPVSLLTDDPAANRAALDISRPDVIISGGIPRFVEFNINSAIGGPEQVTRLDKFFKLSAGSASTSAGGWLRGGRVRVPAPLGSRRAAVLAAARVPRPAVCVLGWAREGFGSREYFADVIDDFARHTDCFFATPDELDFCRGTLTCRGRRADLVLRMFVTADAGEPGLDLTAVRRAMRAGAVTVLSPEAGSLYASKKVLAWLSESCDTLPAADRRFVETHLPWTRVVADAAVTWRGRRIGLLDLLLGQRERFVLKPVDQHSGDGVIPGRDTGDREWEQAVRAVPADGRYVAQEFCPPDSITVPAYLPADGTVRSMRASPVYGPLIFGGRLGGIQVRHTGRPAASLISVFGGRGGVANSGWIVRD